MVFPSSFWQPVRIKKVLSVDFKLFRTVSDHFRTVPGRFRIVFGPFRTVLDSFQTVFEEGATTAQEKQNYEPKICGVKARKFFANPSATTAPERRNEKSVEKQECT